VNARALQQYIVLHVLGVTLRGTDQCWWNLMLRKPGSASACLEQLSSSAP
jgi:hypothetical protein